jgi:hypothetical protein
MKSAAAGARWNLKIDQAVLVLSGIGRIVVCSSTQVAVVVACWLLKNDEIECETICVIYASWLALKLSLALEIDNVLFAATVSRVDLRRIHV